MVKIKKNNNKNTTVVIKFNFVTFYIGSPDQIPPLSTALPFSNPIP